MSEDLVHIFATKLCVVVLNMACYVFTLLHSRVCVCSFVLWQLMTLRRK